MKTILDLSKKISLGAVAFVTTLLISSYSHSEVYFGVDAVMSKMTFKKDYGESIFSKRWAPGGNFFVGAMFHKNFGMELGYEIEQKMKRTATVNAGNYTAGIIVPTALPWAMYNTTAGQSHSYLGILAKANVFDSTFVGLMIGASLSKVNAKYHLFKTSLGPDNVPKTFTKTKSVGLIKGMLEHKIHNQVGVRALAIWKNMSKFKVKPKEAPSNAGENPIEIRLKDTFNFGIGVTYYI